MKNQLAKIVLLGCAFTFFLNAEASEELKATGAQKLQDSDLSRSQSVASNTSPQAESAGKIQPKTAESLQPNVAEAKHAQPLAKNNKFAIKPIGNLNAPEGGTFYDNLDGEPSSLNPLKGTDAYASAVTSYIFDSLLSRNVDTFEFEPSLATSYEIAKDGKSITFVLREGVKFHDGTPLTIDDVKFSFDVAFNEKLSDPVRKMYFENFEKAEIINTKTIKFYIKNVYFKNLEVVAGMEIVPKAIYGDVNRKVNKIMIGSGAYMLDKYDQGQSITLKKNPDWWGNKVQELKGWYKSENIKIRFIKDQTAKLESFKKGDLDFLGLDAEQFEKKTDGPMWGTKLHKIEAKNDAPKGTAFIGFNLRNPKFSDRNVRIALSQLFNIKFMNEKFFYNKYLQATGPWYQQSIFADPNTKGVTFDTKAANAALKKAGWNDSNKDGLIDKMIDGKLLDFRFTIIYGSPVWEKFLTVYKEELKKSGIDLEIKQLEWNAFQKTLNDWNFDAVALAWGGAFDYDPKQIWHSSSITHEGSNFAGYSNPEVDKLIDKVRGEMDVKKRIPTMRKIYSMIAKDCPYIFFYNPQFAYYAYNNRIHMVKPTYKYGIGKDTWWIAP